MELKIDSEKVKEAMEKCPQAREVLVTLFPEMEKPNVNCGDFFISKHGEEIWIVSEPSLGSFQFISLSTGRRWNGQPTDITHIFGVTGRATLSPLSRKEALTRLYQSVHGKID